MVEQPELPSRLSEFLREHFPEILGLALAADYVSDRLSDLRPEEYRVIAQAATKRQHEFATGRYVARTAMASLEIGACAVGRDESRRPIWPEGCLGSISHSGSLAIAAVARSEVLRGVGIDLEEVDRVVSQLHRKLFTPWELAAYAQGDARWSGLLFSAKEAAYKAINPIVGEFIGFQEVEVDVDWPNSQFATRYVGEHAPNKLLDVGSGHFGFIEEHVVTLFLIP
jgi:4'-phosphopantetheinyl transferase EntD